MAIKDKKNIDLFVRNKVLRLSDALYVSGFTVNLISITRLWHNSIGIYYPAGRPIKLSFNGTIFIYAKNVRD